MFFGQNLRLYQELINKHYLAGTGPVGARMGMAAMNAANPITTIAPDGGRFNATFGASLFAQLQTSSVLFNALAKFDYDREGYRVQYTRFVVQGGTTEGTVNATQNASIPDSIAPLTKEINVPIKEQAQTVEYSQRMLLLANKQDDIAMDVAQLLETAKNNYAYQLNVQLNTDVTTLPTTNMESIDRVVSSYAEVTNCADVTAGDSNIYAQDRDSAASWADAYVDHNSNTARPISKKIVANLVERSLRAGADPKQQFWYTGSDTWSQIQQLYDTQIRYMSPETFMAGTMPTSETGKAIGINFGQEMATLMGRPVHVAPAGDVVANGDISNLYLLTSQYDPVAKRPVLGIKMLQAPMLTESRFVDYPKHGKLGNQHLIYSAMELQCSRFNIQAKARDLAVIS